MHFSRIRLRVRKIMFNFVPKLIEPKLTELPETHNSYEEISIYTSDARPHAFVGCARGDRRHRYNIKKDNVVEVTNKAGGNYKGWNTYSGSVTIPETIEYNGTTYPVSRIGEQAFENSKELTAVNIPNSVTSIGGSAFRDCIGLTSIVIPNSVTSIESWAFLDCSNLASVEMSTSLVSIERIAFGNCSALTSITFPSTLKSIGEEAFRSCKSLTSIEIPASVNSIGKEAFSCCSGLSSIRVDAGNQRYNSREDCNAIIEKWSNTLIAGCKNTTIPNGVKIIEEAAFSQCAGLMSATLPNTLESIGIRAFSECSGLTSIDIPASVNSIGESAFASCTGLTSLTLPNTLKNIGEWAFYNCSGLTSLTIPDSVTTIEQRAFSWCTGLKSITIGKGTKSIGLQTFSECKNLETVTCLAEELPRTDWAAFQGASYQTAILYVPTHLLDAYSEAYPWKSFGKIEGISGSVDDGDNDDPSDDNPSGDDASDDNPSGDDETPSAITPTPADERFGKAECYNLNGVKVATPTHPGIYLVKKDGQTKMIVVKK